MTTSNGAGDPAVLRDEIKKIRADLGETVEALAAKADVRARLRDSTAQTKQRIRGQAGHTMQTFRGAITGANAAARRNPGPWVVVATGVVAVVIAVVVMGGRRR
jgi:ElaB/YqjD/DUF883 family membrane-anchored ribosome-binding protein